MLFEKFKHKIISPEEIKQKAKEYYDFFLTRRSVREFSDKEIPFEIIKDIVMTASSAPSGANKQPWRFVIVRDEEIKKKIRIAAEIEEKENYENRFPEEWLEDLRALGTDWHKDFIEDAPYLIVVFKINYEEKEGVQRKNYYVNESVGIAAGFLISAIHNAGLVTLIHTPSPMNFLQKILNRPSNEKAYMLLPLGYPAENAEVPVLKKKSFEETAVVV